MRDRRYLASTFHHLALVALAGVALVRATPALAQCTANGPWPNCTTWSGPSWTPATFSLGGGQVQPTLGIADINGDGLDDLFYLGGFTSPQLGIALSNGSSFTGSAPSLPPNGIDNCYQGNFDGSGRLGIACLTSGSISYATSTGSGYSNYTTQTIAGNIFGLRAGSAGYVIANPCFVMDVDGDGTDDIVCGSPASYTVPAANDPPQPSTTWGVYLSTGGAFSYQVWNGPTGGYTQTSTCIVGDFNGDGLKDLACNWNLGSTNWNVLLSTGKGWAPQVWPNGPASVDFEPDSCLGGTSNNGIDCVNSCVAGDFDGDGIDDIACVSGTNQWSIGFGGGTAGFKNGMAATWAAQNNPGSPRVCFVSDLYGTGRAGILCPGTIGSNSTGWIYNASTGTGFTVTNFTTSWSLLVNGTLPGNVNQICTFGDFNGDGIKDIACNPTGSGTWLMGLSQRQP